MNIPSISRTKSHFSPLRYPGGKTILWPKLCELIEATGLKNVTYVEPFAGGAGAGLALLLKRKVAKIVINDLDDGIFAFWHSIVSDSSKFVSKIQSIPVTVEEWYKQKAVLANPRASLFTKGFATFFLNRVNVSGNLDGGPIGGLKQDGKWRIDARFYRETLARRVLEIASHKDKIEVLNEDGVKIIKRFVKQKNTFLYIDPPYYEKGSTLYLNHYKDKDHETLADVLNQNPDAYWSLTYDDKSRIRSLYSPRDIKGFSLQYNAYESRKGKEVLILSDALAS